MSRKPVKDGTYFQVCLKMNDTFVRSAWEPHRILVQIKQSFTSNGFFPHTSRSRENQNFI